MRDTSAFAVNTIEENCPTATRKFPTEKAERAELEIELAEFGSADPSDDEDDDLKGRLTHRTNNGNKAAGPWVARIYQSEKEMRFFIVRDRKASTPWEIVRFTCTVGCTIRTDEWMLCRMICEDGIVHEKVNHSKWFVGRWT